MCHYAQLTVSETPAAVIVVILYEPLVAVDCVTPPLKVAVYPDKYLIIKRPLPPAAGNPD